MHNNKAVGVWQLDIVFVFRHRELPACALTRSRIRRRKEKMDILQPKSFRTPSFREKSDKRRRSNKLKGDTKDPFLLPRRNSWP